jgi:uncharacterized protein
VSHIRIPGYLGVTEKGAKLELHKDAVTQGFALMGKRRRGKSNLMGSMMEILAAREQSFVCIDPADAHWGIRYAVDDKQQPAGPSDLDVLVVGGDHADVPLDPTAGRELAHTIVDGDISCVICLKALTYTKLQTFCADFGEELFMLNRTPRHIFFDECQNLLPQQLKFDEQKRVLYAMSKIVAEGGGNGLGFTLASQRPSKVNKDVLEEVDNFIVLGMIGPRDLDQVENWFRHHVGGDKEKLEQLIDSVASLPVGDCWFLSPDWMHEITRFHARLRVTYHAGRTPKPGERPVNVAKFSVSEAVEHLKKLFAAKQVERQKEVADLAEAKKQIRELQREVKEAKAAGQIAKKSDSGTTRQAAAEERTIARAVAPLRALLEEAMKVIVKVNAIGFEGMAPKPEEIEEALKATAKAIGKLAESKLAARAAEFERLKRETQRILVKLQKSVEQEDVHVDVTVKRNEPITVSEPRPSQHWHADVESNGDLTPYQASILRGLAELEALGHTPVPRGLAGAAAGKSHKSSTWDRYTAQLRSAGLIGYRQGKLHLTEAGRARIGKIEGALTPEELRERLFRILTPYQRDLVQVAVAAGGETLSIEDLATRAGKQVGSSTFDRYMAALRSMEILESPAPKTARAAAWLFLE